MTKEKLLYLLAVNGKTRKDLAEFLGVTPVQITKWTTGVRPVPKSRYKKIAEFFSIPVKKLEGIVGEEFEFNFIADRISRWPVDERIAMTVYILNTL